jgi:hypothetical protein
MRYELGFYIPDDGILHSHRRQNLSLSLLCLISTKVGHVYSINVEAIQLLNNGGLVRRLKRTKPFELV